MQVLMKAGCYRPERLFGVTTLDVVRAEAFVAEILNVDPKDVKVRRCILVFEMMRQMLESAIVLSLHG